MQLVALGAFVLLVGTFMLLRALGIGPAGSLLAAGAYALAALAKPWWRNRSARSAIVDR